MLLSLPRHPWSLRNAGVTITFPFYTSIMNSFRTQYRMLFSWSQYWLKWCVLPDLRGSGHGYGLPGGLARQHPGSVLAVVEWQVPLHLFRGDLCRRCFFFALNFDLVIILPVVTILTFFLSLLPGPMLICLVRLVSKLFGRNLQVLVRLLVLSLAGLVKTGGGASALWDPGPADTK